MRSRWINVCLNSPIQPYWYLDLTLLVEFRHSHHKGGHILKALVEINFRVSLTFQPSTLLQHHYQPIIMASTFRSPKAGSSSCNNTTVTRQYHSPKIGGPLRGCSKRYQTCKQCRAPSYQGTDSCWCSSSGAVTKTRQNLANLPLRFLRKRRQSSILSRRPTGGCTSQPTPA